MIIVAGSVRVEPAKREAARAIMEKVITASRGEDGCIDYAYAVDVLDPGLVRVWEVWRDRETLQRHFQTPHLGEWRAAWPTFGITDRKLAIYDVSGTTAL
jgi:quinol monooxygenase YgiN